MHLTRLCPILALLALLPLSSCKPSVKSLRHVSVSQSTFREFDDDLNAEARSVVEHYLRTGEVNFASAKRGITMLHIAAASHRLWLVEELLAQGADPNARLRQGEQRDVAGDTPAILAVRAGETETNKDALLIVKALLAKGANLNLQGRSSILSACSTDRHIDKRDISGEELMLELMALGAKRDTRAAFHAVTRWPRALEALLNSAEGPEIVKDMPDLLTACAVSFDGEEAELACAKILLRHTQSVNVLGASKHAPLGILADSYGRWREPIKKIRDCHKIEQQRFVDFFAALTDKGADPLLPDGLFRQSCAADKLALHAELLQELQKRGYNITPPPHLFTEEKLVDQLVDIPTPAIRAEEAVAQFGTIAKVFAAPTPAMLTHEYYRSACAKALPLLHRADAAHTRALLMAQPAWKDVSVWQGEAQAARSLLYSLQENPQIHLPAEWLVESARAMETAGRPRLAHAFIRLLSPDKSSAALINELCEEHTPLPLRAAAWSCRLEQDGLPALGDIQSWYNDRSLRNSGGYEILRRARNAEDSIGNLGNHIPMQTPERLFFDSPATVDEGEYVVKARHELNCPLAAHYCDAEDTPMPEELSAELREFMKQHGMAAAAALELELGIAQYLWQHREKLRPYEFQLEEE